ncbi:hypothetical protein EHP00_2210 [Ecytonucleospora hepatopenaei]|uniref:Uncharacterized protein n=1 Tax=Ecytonucleospora hepatopenaei TaxID=646526 RepID=A0A1W0E4X1_9MICR|nr:hypothetical protein EHP00_2210 [Ecytonucleospora hepatopenaei]
MILIVIYNFGSNTNIYKDISYNQSYTLNNEYNDNKYINEYNDNKYINEYNEYII